MSQGPARGDGHLAEIDGSFFLKNHPQLTRGDFEAFEERSKRLPLLRRVLFGRQLASEAEHLVQAFDTSEASVEVGGLFTPFAIFSEKRISDCAPVRGASESLRR